MSLKCRSDNTFIKLFIKKKNLLFLLFYVEQNVFVDNNH